VGSLRQLLGAGGLRCCVSWVAAQLEGKELNNPGARGVCGQHPIASPGLNGGLRSHRQDRQALAHQSAWFNTAMDCCRTSCGLGAEAVKSWRAIPLRFFSRLRTGLEDARESASDHHQTTHAAPSSFVLQNAIDGNAKFSQWITIRARRRNGRIRRPSAAPVRIPARGRCVLASARERPSVDRDGSGPSSSKQMVRAAVEQKTYVSSNAPPGWFFGGERLGPE